MAYVSVPKDLTKVKTKVLFNLTKRQIICIGIAAAIGLPFYFLTREALGTSNAATGMVLLMLPAILFALFEKDGMPLERILFNRLQAAMDTRAVRSQPMLVPFVLSLNGQEFAFLEKNFGVLHELGFEVEEFGDASVRVTAVPADLKDVDLAAFFGEVLSSMESLRAIRLADILKDKLATAACKAAVKGGETLTLDEVRALLQEMDGDTGMKCPHGRPAVVRMKKSEFEKLFKRIV